MTAKPQDSTNELVFPCESIFLNESIFPFELVFPFVGAGLAPPGVNAATLSPVKLSCLTLSHGSRTLHHPTRIAKFPEEPR